MYGKPPSDGLKFRLRLLFQELDIFRDEFTIGRAPSCSLTVDDPGVSWVHARISISNDRAIITDLESRNGVRVNGRVIAGAKALHHGDQIRIGQYEFGFVVTKNTVTEKLHTTVRIQQCYACKETTSQNTDTCPHCGEVFKEEAHAAIPPLVADPLPAESFGGAWHAKGGANDCDQDLALPVRKADAVEDSIYRALYERNFEQASQMIDRRISQFQRVDASNSAEMDRFTCLCKLNLALAKETHDKNRINWVVERWRKLPLAMPSALAMAAEDATQGWFDLSCKS